MPNKIGNLFVLVEGQVTEHVMLTKLFSDVYSYSVISDNSRDRYLKTDCQEQLEVLVADNNDAIILKTGTHSQLHATLRELDSYSEIPRVYGLRNSALFNTVIIFDKDIHSGNRHEVIKDFFNEYNSVYERGLLIVSYPAFESVMYYMKNDTLITVDNAQQLKTITSFDDADIITHESFLKSMETNKKYVEEVLSQQLFTEDSRMILDRILEEHYHNNNAWKVLSTFYMIFRELTIF